MGAAGDDDQAERGVGRSPWPRWLPRAAVAVLLLWAAGAVGLDRWGLRAPPGGQYDAIVVAGCRVMPDGRASLALAARTAYAVDLWRRKYAPKIVLTGGEGHYPPAEAEAAAVVARSMGVPDEALVLETRSKSTEQNAEFAASLLGPARVLVVTDSYHAWRCRRVFARYFGGAEAVGRPPTIFFRVKGALREVVAIAVYAAQGRLSAPAAAGGA